MLLGQLCSVNVSMSIYWSLHHSSASPAINRDVLELTKYLHSSETPGQPFLPDLLDAQISITMPFSPALPISLWHLGAYAHAPPPGMIFHFSVTG